MCARVLDSIFVAELPTRNQMLCSDGNYCLNPIIFGVLDPLKPRMEQIFTPSLNDFRPGTALEGDLALQPFATRCPRPSIHRPLQAKAPGFFQRSKEFQAANTFRRTLSDNQGFQESAEIC